MADELMVWTKKIDELHYALIGFHSETLCGRPMLGNNYVGTRIANGREFCEECLKVAREKGLIK